MINEDVGQLERGASTSAARTRPGREGHVVYGPYTELGPGDYVARFTITLLDAPDDDDVLCAFLDVTTDLGRRTIAETPIFVSQLAVGAPTTLQLPFRLNERAKLEYRVHVNASRSLLVVDDARAELAGDAAQDATTQPRYVREQPHMLKRIYDMRVRIMAEGDRLVMEKDGVRFNANTYDDTNFVHEIFVVGAYNMQMPRPTCLIDVGMNVALASLLFATRPFIQEVHAFEPFETTRQRGLANLALNPALAAKIQVNPFGLGDQDGEVTFRIHDNGDSGGMATRDQGEGVAVRVQMRDAAGALAPIIRSARERGLDVVLKIDCEGSEFAIFQSLAAAGLFAKVRALMVEWHRVFDGRDQKELLGPLIDSGFAVFDITQPVGNGFFYAARYN